MEPKILGFSYKNIPGKYKIAYAVLLFAVVGLAIFFGNIFFKKQ